MREDIHNSIASLTATLFHNPPRFQVTCAHECGGSRRPQLFGIDSKRREHAYCWPDILITRDREVRLILEIEQTGIVSPGKIGSKLLPISVSNYLYSKDIGAEPIPMSEGLTFVQIVNTAHLPAGSRKIDQYENLQSSIRSLLPLGRVRDYYLFPLSAAAEPPYDAAKYERVLQVINESLGN